MFKQLGVYDELEPKAAIPTAFTVRRYSDGTVLARTRDFDHELREKYGVPFLDLHRVDVQRALAARAKALGAEVRLGCRVADIDFDAATLTLESGESLEADLLVGADGLWSKCRERFLAMQGKSEDAPLPTGDLAYRIVLNLDEISDLELKEIVSKPTCQLWIGPGSHVVAYSVRGGTMFNVVLLVPDDLPADVARQSASLDEMRKLFTNWDPVLNRFLDQVKTVDKWKLMHRPELESWVGGDGKFVFVGDAAHPMLPCECTSKSCFLMTPSDDTYRPRAGCQLKHRRRRCARLHPLPSSIHRPSFQTCRSTSPLSASSQATG